MCIFPRMFSIIFPFLLILMDIFEKLPQILGLCPIVKFRSTREKSDPPNIWRTPLNRKILYALLSLPHKTTGIIKYLMDSYYNSK